MRVTLGECHARIRLVDADGCVAVSIMLGFPSEPWRGWLQPALVELLASDGKSLAHLELSHRIATHAVQPNVTALANVRNVIAIGSGKGGVGKSTTAVNLALALAADGARVGVLDADVYGPSVPMMLGLHGRPDSTDGKSIEPIRAHGIEAMSIGLLVEADTPMIWRGPMATSALTQLLNDTRWGDLDYLIVDLPPGTGDIQLTLAQKIPVAGAVIVTTPQDLATLDARKALRCLRRSRCRCSALSRTWPCTSARTAAMPSICSAKAAGRGWQCSMGWRCWAACRWPLKFGNKAMQASPLLRPCQHRPPPTPTE